jgi:DNA-binding transcriptional MerR regulator
VSERPYLSIGEVLGILLEEFPDVTISKIRFLESQGLIDPERTPSGYRKFYDDDVDRLRFILREQREHYLPLRVIKDKLDDPTTQVSRPSPPPRGIRNVAAHIEAPVRTEDHPSAAARLAATPVLPPDRPPEPATAVSASGSPAAASNDTTGPIGRVAGIDRDELIALTGIDPESLAELESFGLLQGRRIGDRAMYDTTACEIAEVAARFVRLGVEVRHLRAWRTAVEREAALFEQRVTPLLHQRNPQAREQFVQLLDEMAGLGGRLHDALMQMAVRHLIEGR